MKTPFAFCYDMWTTTDEKGKIHYWVRIKETDDITEVNHEVMKFLRASEKKLRRELKKNSRMNLYFYFITAAILCHTAGMKIV